LHNGAPLNADDPTTYYGRGEKGYTDHPSLEQDRGNKPKPVSISLEVTLRAGATP
jgi:N-ethylmaleimide reductase